MVTARRIKDNSETSPLPCWPFTVTPYTLSLLVEFGRKFFNLI